MHPSGCEPAADTDSSNGANAGPLGSSLGVETKERAVDVGFQVVPPLELMEIVYTSGPPIERGTGNRTAAGPRSGASSGDPPPRTGGHGQRLDDLSVLRNHPPGLLHVAPPLRRAGPGRPAGTLTAAAREPERHEGRSGREDRLSPSALPLRAAQDRHVPEALPRRADQPVGGLENPEAPGHEPAAGLPALPAPCRSVDTLREALARPPGPDRREVHRSAAGLSEEEALPVHRDR